MGVSAMGRMRENPRYNVVSMRISDEERATLDDIMYTTNKSVSQLMREAMEIIKHQSGQEMRKAA
jgi:predicted transcriptional regulator